MFVLKDEIEDLKKETIYWEKKFSDDPILAKVDESDNNLNEFRRGKKTRLDFVGNQRFKME